MATIYKTDGTEQEISPLNGKDFSLEELTTIVGGYIEIILFKDNQFMVLNEEGKLIHLPINAVATNLYNNNNDYIVGNVLVCKRDQIKLWI